MDWKRSWQWHVFCTFHISQCYDLAPDENSCFLGSLHTHSPLFVLWDKNVWTACAGCLCVCCILSIGINRVSHRGYRVLRRTHMFGLRVATKPCLQKHLYEPAVFTHRAFLHEMTRVPGSAHSSMSKKHKHRHLQMAVRK